MAACHAQETQSVQVHGQSSPSKSSQPGWRVGVDLIGVGHLRVLQGAYFNCLSCIMVKQQVEQVTVGLALIVEYELQQNLEIPAAVNVHCYLCWFAGIFTTKPPASSQLFSWHSYGRNRGLYMFDWFDVLRLWWLFVGYCGTHFCTIFLSHNQMNSFETYWIAMNSSRAPISVCKPTEKGLPFCCELQSGLKTSNHLIPSLNEPVWAGVLYNYVD